MAFRVSVEPNNGFTKMILNNLMFQAGNRQPSVYFLLYWYWLY